MTKRDLGEPLQIAAQAFALTQAQARVQSNVGTVGDEIKLAGALTRRCIEDLGLMPKQSTIGSK